MKIVLVGYGKMGKEIEKLAIQRNHSIIAVIDQSSDWKDKEKEIEKADVAIEFSVPSVAVENIKKCFDRNIPVVVGTTGWYDSLEEVKSWCIESMQTLFFASNYSIGVNIFFQINQLLAQLMNGQKGYNVTMQEIHHIHKMDAPSGTAITLAEDIIKNYSQKEKWKLSEKINSPSVLSIEALRINEVPGTHTVMYASEIDSITITHEAKSRKGFALGAILAAEFIKGKKGIYGMNDLIHTGRNSTVFE